MYSINQLLAEAEGRGFKDRLAAEVLLAEVLELSKEYIFVHGDESVNNNLVLNYLNSIDLMLDGKPLAQILGYKEFYGHRFKVNDHVLIPRPESELIVDLVKKFVDDISGSWRVLDVGTGSGAILIAVLKELINSRGVGTEVSAEAAKVATENAVFLKVSERVQILEGNLLEPIEEPVDIILANLPYIGREKFNFIADNVARHEPEIALYGGADGLDLYREMFAQLRGKKWKPKFMAGEFGFGQADLMKEILLENFPEEQCDVIDDLAGIPRVFVVVFNSQN